jgi:hypothetical protein
MSSTRTYTATKTWSRLNLIKLQVRIMLQRGAVITREGVDSVVKGVENKWIDRVFLYGFDKNNRVNCELVIGIQWSRHEVHMTAGRLKVTTTGWTNDTSIELQECLTLFNEYVEANSLRSECQVSYASHYSELEKSEFNRVLGFVPGTPPIWSAQSDGVTSKIPELDEVSVSLFLVK